MITSNTVPIVTGPSADIEMLDVPEVVFGIDGDDVTFTTSEYVEVRQSEAPEYEGPYEFTPTEETQTVECENMLTTENIVINPIPNNYGLITWNGSIITVS